MFGLNLKLPCDLTREQVAFLSEAFELDALTTSGIRENNHKDGDWFMEWLFKDKPDILKRHQMFLDRIHQDESIKIVPDLQDWTIKEIEQKNWLEECYRAFPPFSVGPFFIFGSHYEGDKPSEQIPLEINAATAFGSGEHGTTRGCLEAMLDLKSLGICPWNTLDMGTGSGILAIAAWKLWQAPIVAADNDEESVRVTEEHAHLNDIKLGNSTLLVGWSNGSEANFVKAKAPYELIIANILAGPLLEMAEDLVALMDDNSYLILSGMLHEQASEILMKYEGQLGLKEKRRYERGDWTTLVLHKV